MGDWYLIPAGKSLFGELNKLAPNRDKTSDGSIGDAAHQAEPTSDHNPDIRGAVHAIDVDDDLRLPGWTMERVVQLILARCRAGKETRLKYVIYNRRIWSLSSGWVQRPYTGASAHTEHAHFSFRYTVAAEQNISPWGLLAEQEDDMPTAKEIATEVIKGLDKAGIRNGRTVGGTLDGLAKQSADHGVALAALVTYAKGEAAEVAPSAEQNATAVLDMLAAAGRSDQDVADALRAALGDRATTVGQLLAGAGQG
jgi:hypothetical protein